jgi:DNA-binding NtrC family response regulator
MAQTAFILILTEDEAAGERLREALRERHGHSSVVVTRLADALDSIRGHAPDVVVADARVTGEPTARPLAELLDQAAPDGTLFVVGAEDELPATRHVHVTALTLPPEREKLVQPIATAARKAVAQREDRLLNQTIASQRREAFEGIVGQSRPIVRLIERIRKAADNKLTVLILGETGVGKDLIARAIHRRSARAARPFKSLNCAGLNENLLESELFGHVRGAFTGAERDYKGYFAAAESGTLFLDEIGDMPLTMQSKLLRALDDREITPVGSTDSRKVDVRLIAATHVDLLRAVAEKKFREDLLYRLRQWVIQVPPLRERREDIPLLADWFRQKANREHDRACPGISSEAMGYLARYYWPGNVRELAALIEATVVEVEDRQLESDDLPEYIRGSREIIPLGAGGGFAGLTMAQIERIAIERTLQATGGNREQAAKQLDIGTRTLYRKIKEYGL